MLKSNLEVSVVFRSAKDALSRSERRLMVLPSKSRRPRLTQARILAWADAYFRRTGAWPKVRCAPVAGTRGRTWKSVDVALRRGGPGLPGRSSLAQLLADYRGVRNRARLPPLTEELILAWADAHFRQTV